MSVQYVTLSTLVRVGTSLLGFFERIARFLWAKEWLACEKERIAHCSSFVKSDERKSFPSLFKKEWWSEKQRDQFALDPKKGEKQWKTVKNIWKIWIFFRVNCLFLRAFCLSKERQEQFTQSRYFLKRDESELLTVAL